MLDRLNVRYSSRVTNGGWSGAKYLRAEQVPIGPRYERHRICDYVATTMHCTPWSRAHPVAFPPVFHGHELVACHQRIPKYEVVRSTGLWSSSAGRQAPWALVRSMIELVGLVEADVDGHRLAVGAGDFEVDARDVLVDVAGMSPDLLGLDGFSALEESDRGVVARRPLARRWNG